MLVVLNAVVQQVDHNLSDMGGTADHVWPRGVRQTIVLHCDAVTGRAELAQH